MTDFRNLDTFTRGYIECALWSSVGDSDDEGLGITDSTVPEDISEECLKQMVADCAKFQAENEDALNLAYLSESVIYSESRAGHDFWLTRCGHGAGFWDGDLPEEVGEVLTDAAKKYGNIDLYRGDDGFVYGA